MGKALILTDGKAGHENQSKALARALGCEYEIVEVAFRSKFAKVLSYLFDRVGIRTQALWKFVPKVFASTEPLPPLPEPFQPSAVLGTGSGTFYAAKSLAKTCKAKCGVVLYPRGYDLASFDCVLAPAFDNPKAAPNVIEIPANLVAADEAFYEKGVAAFRERHEPKGEGVAVIVGGPNKCSTMTPEWMKAQLDAIFAPSTKHQAPSTSFLDMGCGSGFVGLLVAKSLPPGRVRLTSVDSHVRAIMATKENALALGVACDAILSDVGTPPETDGTFDVVAMNPPYYGDWSIAGLFFETAFRALKPGGVCHAVAKNGFGLRKEAEKRFPKTELVSRRGYVVLKCTKSSLK